MHELLQREFPVVEPHVAGRDQALVGDVDRMQLAFDIVRPEMQEFGKDGIARGEVVFLPDIGLQEFRVIGKVIKDFCCRQAVILEDLLLEIGHLSPFNSLP